MNNIIEQISLTSGDVKQINTQVAQSLSKGEVALVRSGNIPEYGDHFIVIIGTPVQKPHGLRPKTITVQIPGRHHPLLDEYKPYNGATILLLNKEKKKAFYIANGISDEMIEAASGVATVLRRVEKRYPAYIDNESTFM